MTGNHDVLLVSQGLDIGLALLYLVLVMVTWYSWQRAQVSASTNAQEAEPLLGQRQDDATEEPTVHDEEDSTIVPVDAPLPVALRVLPMCIVLTWMAQLAVLAFQQVLSNPAPSPFYHPLRAASTLVGAFAWILAAAWSLVIVSDKRYTAVVIPRGMRTFLWFAAVGDVLLLLMATVTLATSSGNSWAEWTALAFLCARIGIIWTLAIWTTLESTWEASSTDSAGSDKTFWSRVQHILPFLWPNTSRLQLCLLGCFVCLVLGRIINLFVPIQYKYVIDALTPGSPSEVEDKRPYFAWGAILIFVGIRFLQGNVGLVTSLQNMFWIPVGQYTTREISVSMLAHLHNLSLSFHLSRKTGEVLRIMDRGTSSIGSLLNYVLFNIFPVIVDILVAVVFFILSFSWEFGLIVGVTMGLYMYLTILITEWRIKFRREMIELDNAANARAVDSLLNFETVKYYAAEQQEVNAYRDAMLSYQRADWKSSASLYVLNSAQNLVITLGLLVGSLLCAWKVIQGDKDVSDFVLFLTYITQLYAPLNWFGTYYRAIQQNLIDMEKMMNLFEQSPSVKDAPDAAELAVDLPCSVEFNNVSFNYDPRHPGLTNVSFTVPAGQTVAVVGPSGGGKTTIFRLLFRFWDVDEGSICISGHDIRKYTQTSVRRHFGVVPQDPVLFNNSIRSNLEYVQPGVSQEEIEAATKAAQIHDTILSFPDGYETQVGERGLRLSGGEKQRMAMARALLTRPPILLLDEATSALDTPTERAVQEAWRRVSAGRTTLIIAHRLSTIVHADTILVLKQGQIVERGTHEALLKQEGLYATMWHQQQSERPSTSS